ncbi:MAG: sialidase family protein [Elusimicrobiota bacterium]
MYLQKKMLSCLLVAIATSINFCEGSTVKISTGVVYQNDKSYSTFPGVVKLQSGDLLVVFREAPRRKKITHIDPESKISFMRSKDNGQTWQPAGEVVSGKESIGLQDPSVMQMKDGTLILSSFMWELYVSTDEMKARGVKTSRKHTFGKYRYAGVPGVYIWRSVDEGKTWDGPVANLTDVPPLRLIATSEPAIEVQPGELLLPLYGGPGGKSIVVLVSSKDRGTAWVKVGEIRTAQDNKDGLQEPGLLKLSDDKVVCISRPTPQEVGFSYQSVSEDNGRTWTPAVRTSFWGYPSNLLLLSNNNVLCSYGYRKAPYGVRACISRDECKTWDIENELVLYTDAPGGDLGYPSSVELPDGNVLTVYYTHTSKGDDGVRYIALTIFKP